MKILEKINDFGWKKIILLLIIVLSFIALIQPYFHSGFPYTHDGENHLARFANYKIAIKEGQFPPRVGPNLLNHYGYPVFNYNYPLANILSLPFSFLKIHYEITFKILAVGFLLGGGLGLWQWMKILKVDDFTRKCLILASFYLNPFIVNLIYVRGNIGELLAVNLLLMIMASLEYFKQQKINNRESAVSQFLLVGLVICFLLSHNIAAVFGSGLLVIYVLYRFWNDKKRLFLLGKIFFLSLLSSLWFWLPALAEKHLIILDNSDITHQYAQHFPTFSQLLFAPLEFGFSVIGPVDSMSFAVGLLNLGLLVVSSLFLLKKKKLKSLAGWLLISCWLLIIFQLSVTNFVWKILPVVHYLQFPWRLSLFLSVILPLAVSVSLPKLNKKLFAFFFLILMTQLINVWRFRPADYFHRERVAYDLFSQSSSTMNENMTKVFDLYKIHDFWKPQPIIVQGAGKFTVEHWTGSSRRYQLNLTEPSTVVEPTMLFAGWQTWVNGDKIEYALNDKTGGRLAYELPAGQYQIKTRFTQRTWPRIIGNGVSAAGMIVSLFYLIKKIKK